MSDFRALLTGRLSGLLELTTSESASLEVHYRLLQEWNRRLNLTAIQDMEAVVERHYCESIFLGSFLPPVPLAIVDVGSGPGFPGFPIAVLRQDCTVSLVESSSKKAVFLREAGRNIGNLKVLESRAEILTLRFDWIVSRAVRGVDVVKLMPRLARNVALLIGEGGLVELDRVPGVKWADPILLPWGKRRVLARGFHVEP